MAQEITVKINSAEFAATLRRYAAQSKRDPKQICDTKAFFVARGAARLTKRVTKAQIASDLGKEVKRKNGGRILKLAASAYKTGVSLAEMIIRSRFAKRGAKQPSASEVGVLISKLIAARVRSIAFIASGNIAAIKTLEPLAWTKRGAPRPDRQAKQYGASKGYAKPAQESWIARTIIGNTADATRDNKAALDLYGSPAYREALENERQSMLKHMEDKLRTTAQKAGIRTR
jgi:hypothetical protein